MGRSFILLISIVIVLAVSAMAAVSPWDGEATHGSTVPHTLRSTSQAATAVGNPVDFSAALSSAAIYLRNMQADVTEDNAGNGNPDNPNDPDDGGWDWSVVSPPAPFFHTTAASPKNIYGVTALGVYYAYLKSPSAALLTTMGDAATKMAADVNIRSASDLIFLMLYDDLSAVAGTTYQDAARAKFDARITTYGSAGAFAAYIRDARHSQGYDNGIIAWDISIFVRAAAMLADRYGTVPYDYAQAADDMAEVIWQDSYNANPGYFDLTACAGWDSTYANKQYWWYTLGVAGLLEAFAASGTHTSDMPGLATLLLDSQTPEGAVCGSYGVHAGDEDWQSTAYAGMALAYFDQATYQTEINHMGYWLAATQDVSGGWKYSDNSHLPEICGEAASCLSFAEAPMVVIVDDTFAGQADVDAYNTANSTNYLWGYDAFAVIADGISAVQSGGTVNVLAGAYAENLIIAKPLSIIGEGDDVVTLYPAISAPMPGGGGSLPPGSSNIMVVQANDVSISGMTLDGDNPSLTSGVVAGGADLDARNGIITNHTVGVYSNLNVNYCTVKNIYLRAIYASSGGTFNFSYNIVQNVRGEYASIGLFNFGGAGVFDHNTVSDCNDAIAANWSKGTQFTNNVVSNSGTGIHTDNAGNYAGSVADLIQDNTISDGATNAYGIFTFAPYIAPVVHRNTITNVDVGLTCAGSYAAVVPQFTNNVVDCTGRPNATGMYVTTEIWGWTSGNVSADFTNNSFANCADGMYVVAETGFTNNLTFFGNSMTGCTNSYVIPGATTGTFNLQLSGNWWGSNVAATIAPFMQAAGADYTPWLDSGTDISADPGFQGDFSKLWVDDNSPQIGTVNRVQEAVDMVTGSTVYLMPGTYVGQVVADGFTNLNIIGSGVDSTFINPSATAMTHYFLTGSNKNYGIISAENSDAVNVSNLTVDGLGLGGLNYRFVGIAYFNAGGTVDGCVIKDIRNTPINGGQHGIGVYAYTTALPTRAVAVRNSKVSGFQKGGISLNGNYTTAEVSGCEVLGYGPANFIAMNGIQIGFGATGSITNNQVYGCSYTPATWVSSGILLYDAVGTITCTHNTVTESQVGIYYINVGGRIDSNVVTNTPAGTGLTYYWNIVADPNSGAASKIPPVAPIDHELAVRASARAAAVPALIATSATGNVLDGAGQGTGLEADAYSPEVLNFTATANRTTNFEAGIVLWEEAGATLSSVLSQNVMLSNGWGLINDGGAVDAQFNIFSNTANADDNVAGNYYNQNCWSDWSGSGPYAVGGTGANVDNNPSADCGLDMSPDNIVYLCGSDFSVLVKIGDAVTALDGADIRIEYPAELTVTGVTAASANFFSTFTQTNHAAGQKDTLVVNLGVLTGVLDGPADLFTISMNGSTNFCTASQIAMYYRDLRDSTNAAILVPLATAVTFMADCADPVFVVNSPASGGYYNAAPVIDIGASDNCDLDAVYYQIDGCAPGGWLPIATGLSGVAYADPAWVLPDFASLSEASHCVRFKVLDDATRGNGDSCSFTWCFTKDITAPAPPTNLVAKPGHDQVHLSWMNSASSDVTGIRLQRVPWTNYPNYGTLPGATVAPAYPANHTTGATVFDSAASSGMSVLHNDVSGLSNAARDIYYYGAFAYDAAGNFSIAASSAQDRATSYWLGDISDNTVSPNTSDGYVYLEDLALLSVAYGTKDGDAAFYDDADFGPTFTGSPKGIPNPDDSVQFEDLVIFAINFDAVNPAMKAVPVFAATPIRGELALSLEAEEADGNFTYHLFLNNNPGTAKAIHAVLAFDENLTVSDVSFNPALVGSTQPVFAKALHGQGTLTLDAAMLGTGYTFGGSGEIASIRITSQDGTAPTLTLRDGDIRDIENQSLSVSLISPSITNVPATYRLTQNYPNPFNPVTEIAYELPLAGRVRLEVINMLGQTVVALIDEYKEAGSYTVQWDGTDASGSSVASGIYLYRLTASSYTATRKMTLIK